MKPRHLGWQLLEHEDLHRALHGGGGNSGVVTSLTYRLHLVSTVLAGGLVFPPEKARAALRFYYERHRDNTIEVMLEFAATSPSPYTGIGLQQMTGVASRWTRGPPHSPTAIGSTTS